jgi:transcriptional regulator with XRE-family HTH domain
MTQRELARLIGVHFTYVNQILAGRRSPGLANALAMERVTGIPAEAWVPTAVGQSDEPVGVGARKRK